MLVSVKPRTHGRGTRRAKHIEFLGQFSTEAAEELGGTRAPIEQRGNREHVLYFLVELLVGFLGEIVHTAGFLGRIQPETRSEAEFCRGNWSCVRGLRLVLFSWHLFEP